MTARAPLVGRKQPLLELIHSLDDAFARRGAVALVSGELGIGKTRLVDELAERAGTRGAIVASGRWYESKEQPGDIGLRDALRELIAHQPVRSALDVSDPYARELARLGPEFARGLGPQRRGEPRREAEQYQLWRAVLLLLEASSSVAPTVIVLDDLQWADPGSLGLLAFLGTKIEGMPVLLVGTYRQEDVPRGHALHETVAELVRTPSFRRIALNGLSLEEVGALAAGISGLPVSADFAGTLLRQTRGNPLFVSEVVRHLLTSDTAPRGRDPTATRASYLEVSEGLRDVITRRIEALSEACRSLLSRAAVVGREFDVALVELVSCADRETVLASIDEARRAATLHEVAAGRFDFAHPLVRSVIYGGLPPSERVQAHLQAAAALRSYYGANADVHAREIARHLLAAGGIAESSDIVKCCLLGARQAREGFALEDARSLLQGGLAACERLSEPNAALRAQLLVELGYAESGLGNPDGALAVYGEALGLYERLDNPQEALDVRRRLAATLARYGRWSDVLALTRPSLESTPEEASDAFVGLVGSHAMALMVSGAAEEARAWVERILALAFDRGTRAVAHHVAACWHSWAIGDPEESSQHFLEAQRLFQEEGLLATASQVALDHTIVAYFLGRPEESAEADRDAERLAQETGRLSVLADLYGFRSLMSVHRGDWQRAAELRARCREIASRLGGTTIYGQLVDRGEALESGWREGPAAARLLLRRDHPLRNEPLRALLFAEEGDRDSATLLIDQLVALVPANGRGLFWLSVALPIVATLATLERPEVQAWQPSLSLYRGGVFDWFLADVERGEIYARAGHWEEAEACLRNAIQVCQERGLRPFLGLAYYHRALLLLARRARDDRREASTLLGLAEEIFSELELNYLREKVRWLRVRPKRGRPRAEGPSGLTERESTVLSLLAEGRSNRDIARALYVTEKTVARHLESVYRKLGVSNRGAAIARALREQDGRPKAANEAE